MSGQGFKVLKVSERFYEGLFFYRHPKVLLKPQHRTPPNRSTTNVAVDRNAPAARKSMVIYAFSLKDNLELIDSCDLDSTELRIRSYENE